MDKLIKGINSYLTIAEAEELLNLEYSEAGERFVKLPTETKAYFLQRATAKIEGLEIGPKHLLGWLTFPLPYQAEVPFEVELACAIEAMTSAFKANSISAPGIATAAATAAKNGITSESEKTASVTYSDAALAKYASSPFDSTQAMDLLMEFLPGWPARTYRMR